MILKLNINRIKLNTLNRNIHENLLNDSIDNEGKNNKLSYNIINHCNNNEGNSNEKNETKPLLIINEDQIIYNGQIFNYDRLASKYKARKKTQKEFISSL